MALVVRCPNAGCGHSTQLGEDPLGRVFRCPRCRAKLPTSSATPAIVARDLGTEGSSSRTLRSTAVASMLAACDSSAWNHPVLISTWQSSTLAVGEA